jgi:hypothetical protein
VAKSFGLALAEFTSGAKASLFSWFCNAGLKACATQNHAFKNNPTGRESFPRDFLRSK